MKTDFFDGYEKMNDGYLNFFNNRTHFFIGMTEDRETEKYSILDRRLKDRKGRWCNVELKIRTCDINTHEHLFIEQKKWEVFKRDYEEKGILPIYINFMKNGHNVFIISLKDYFDGKRSIEKTTVEIKNKGYERTDHNEVRYLIPVREGHFYQYDEITDRFNRRW